ncbi:uncharacterized protein PDZ-GEF isoform X3 [Panulirus ornatus]|uniref:uncharacterized protein PDZ-GEF isoform X3 n=1 Tax=Panulirus ornatus TaxID=150431 RepID=UPI003A8ADA86
MESDYDPLVRTLPPAGEPDDLVPWCADGDHGRCKAFLAHVISVDDDEEDEDSGEEGPDGRDPQPLGERPTLFITENGIGAADPFEGQTELSFANRPLGLCGGEYFDPDLVNEDGVRSVVVSGLCGEAGSNHDITDSDVDADTLSVSPVEDDQCYTLRGNLTLVSSERGESLTHPSSANEAYESPRAWALSAGPCQGTAAGRSAGGDEVRRKVDFMGHDTLDAHDRCVTRDVAEAPWFISKAFSAVKSSDEVSYSVETGAQDSFPVCLAEPDPRSPSSGSPWRGGSCDLEEDDERTGGLDDVGRSCLVSIPFMEATTFREAADVVLEGLGARDTPEEATPQGMIQQEPGRVPSSSSVTTTDTVMTPEGEEIVIELELAELEAAVDSLGVKEDETREDEVEDDLNKETARENDEVSSALEEGRQIDATVDSREDYEEGEDSSEVQDKEGADGSEAQDQEGEDSSEVQDLKDEDSSELKDQEGEDSSEVQDQEGEDSSEFQDLKGEDSSEVQDQEGEHSSEVQDLKGEDRSELKDQEGEDSSEVQDQGEDSSEVQDLKGEDSSEVQGQEGEDSSEVQDLKGEDRSELKDQEGEDISEVQDQNVEDSSELKDQEGEDSSEVQDQEGEDSSEVQDLKVEDSSEVQVQKDEDSSEVQDQEGEDSSELKDQEGEDISEVQDQEGEDNTEVQDQEGEESSEVQDQEGEDNAVVQDQEGEESSEVQDQEGEDSSEVQDQEGEDSSEVQDQEGKDNTEVQDQEDEDNAEVQDQEGEDSSEVQDQEGEDSSEVQDQEGEDSSEVQDQEGEDSSEVQDQEGEDSSEVQDQEGEDSSEVQDQEGEDNAEVQDQEGEDSSEVQDQEGEDNAEVQDQEGEDSSEVQDQEGEDSSEVQDQEGEDSSEVQDQEGEDNAEVQDQEGEDSSEVQDQEGEDSSEVQDQEGEENAEVQDQEGEDSRPDQACVRSDEEDVEATRERNEPLEIENEEGMNEGTRKELNEPVDDSVNGEGEVEVLKMNVEDESGTDCTVYTTDVFLCTKLSSEVTDGVTLEEEGLLSWDTVQEGKEEVKEVGVCTEASGNDTEDTTVCVQRDVKARENVFTSCVRRRCLWGSSGNDTYFCNGSDNDGSEPAGGVGTPDDNSPSQDRMECHYDDNDALSGPTSGQSICCILGGVFSECSDTTGRTVGEPEKGLESEDNGSVGRDGQSENGQGTLPQEGTERAGAGALSDLIVEDESSFYAVVTEASGRGRGASPLPECRDEGRFVGSPSQCSSVKERETVALRIKKNLKVAEIIWEEVPSENVVNGLELESVSLNNVEFRESGGKVEVTFRDAGGVNQEEENSVLLQIETLKDQTEFIQCSTSDEDQVDVAQFLEVDLDLSPAPGDGGQAAVETQDSLLFVFDPVCVKDTEELPVSGFSCDGTDVLKVNEVDIGNGCEAPDLPEIEFCASDSVEQTVSFNNTEEDLGVCCSEEKESTNEDLNEVREPDVQVNVVEESDPSADQSEASLDYRGSEEEDQSLKWAGGSKDSSDLTVSEVSGQVDVDDGPGSDHCEDSEVRDESETSLGSSVVGAETCLADGSEVRHTSHTGGASGGEEHDDGDHEEVTTSADGSEGNVSRDDSCDGPTAAVENLGIDEVALPMTVFSGLLSIPEEEVEYNSDVAEEPVENVAAGVAVGVNDGELQSAGDEADAERDERAGEQSDDVTGEPSGDAAEEKSDDVIEGGDDDVTGGQGHHIHEDQIADLTGEGSGEVVLGESSGGEGKSESDGLAEEQSREISEVHDEDRGEHDGHEQSGDVAELDDDVDKEQSVSVIEEQSGDVVEEPSYDVDGVVLEESKGEITEEKFGDLAEEQSGGPPEEQSGGPPEEQRGDPPEEQRGEPTPDHSGEPAEEEIINQSGDKSDDVTEEQSGDVVEEQATDKAEKCTSDLAEEETCDTGEEQTSDLTEENTCDVAEEQIRDLAIDQTSDLAEEQTCDVGVDQTYYLAEQTCDLVVEQTSDLAEEHSCDLVAEQTCDLTEEDSGELAEEQSSELVVEEGGDLAQEKSVEEAGQQCGEEVGKQISNLTEEHGGDLTEELNGVIAEEESGGVPEEQGAFSEEKDIDLEDQSEVVVPKGSGAAQETRSILVSKIDRGAACEERSVEGEEGDKAAKCDMSVSSNRDSGTSYLSEGEDVSDDDTLVGRNSDGDGSNSSSGGSGRSSCKGFLKSHRRDDSGVELGSCHHEHYHHHQNHDHTCRHSDLDELGIMFSGGMKHGRGDECHGGHSDSEARRSQEHLREREQDDNISVQSEVFRRASEGGNEVEGEEDGESSGRRFKRSRSHQFRVGRRFSGQKMVKKMKKAVHFGRKAEDEPDTEVHHTKIQHLAQEKSFGKRSGGGGRRANECLILEPSEMIVIDYPDVQLMRPGQRGSCNTMNLEKLMALEQDEITIRPGGRGAPPPPPGHHHHHQFDAEHHLHAQHHHSHHDPYLPDLVGSAILRGARSRGSVGSSVRDGSDTSSAYSGSDTMCHSLQSSLEPDDVDLSGLTESAVDSDEEDLAESMESLAVRDAVRECLEKDPSERTEDDIKVLLEFTQRLRAFSNMTLAVRKAMCQAMVFAVVEEAGTVLMNNGEELDSWSVIINGHVEVSQPDGSVHELHLGDSFGITPTMEKLYHQGTMRSKVDDCQFVCIRQTDYYRILHQSEENIRRHEENGVLVLVTEQRPIDAGNRKGNIVIKGTAERLMQQLVEVENNVDPTYVEDFLLTHRTFIESPLVVANRLLQWFKDPSLRDRVTRVVLLWVNNHFTDFEMDPVMMNFLEQFEEGLGREKMAGQLRLLDFACATKARARTVTLTKPSRDEILHFSILGGYERGFGVFISKVEKGSKAEDVGLKRGDQILEVNGQSFDHMTHAKALEILRQNCHLSITVKSNLLAFKEMLMTPENSPRPQSRKSSDALGPLDNNGHMALGSNFASAMTIASDHIQQSPRDKYKVGNNKGSFMTTKANKLKKKVIESLMPKNNALDSQANSDDSVSSQSSVGGGLYHSHSNPDLSTTGTYEDVRTEFPEHVLKVYRATDQAARFLPVHKETTAREVVMLALQIFNINDPSGSSNYALYEVTVTEEGITKQKRLPDSLQNLAERIGLSSRYYLKNITVSQTLFPDDIVNELIRESAVYFLQLNSVELAIQLTLEDYTVFRQIEPTEYIDYLFNLKSKYGTPALSRFAELVNREMFWVVTEVCSEHNLVKRSKTIKQFIKVARQCKECKNFNSMFAILSGLGHGSVSRLKQTWERLPSKYQRMYQEMQDLMDPSRNMSKYRNLVQNENIQSPIIPFYPVVARDLTFTHEGNDDKVEGLINFEKLRMISRYIRDLQNMCSAPYDLFTIQDAGGQPPSSALISLNQMAAGGHQIATVKRRKKSTAAPDKKKMYEEAQMVRRVKAYLSRMNTCILTDEEELRNMSYECEGGSEGHKVAGGSVGHNSNSSSGSSSAPPTNPPPRKRPNSPTPSTTSSTSSTSQTSDGKKQTTKFGATSPQSISKMKALAEPKTKPHHGPRSTTTHHSLSPTPSPGPPRRGAMTNNNSRSTHERSHSDTHAVPVDLSAESSSVTSLSKLHKSHTSGSMTSNECQVGPGESDSGISTHFDGHSSSSLEVGGVAGYECLYHSSPPAHHRRYSHQPESRSQPPFPHAVAVLPPVPTATGMGSGRIRRGAPSVPPDYIATQLRMKQIGRTLSHDGVQYYRHPHHDDEEEDAQVSAV